MPVRHHCALLFLFGVTLGQRQMVYEEKPLGQVISSKLPQQFESAPYSTCNVQYVWIILHCHLDGQVSRISARALSRRLIFDRSCYAGYHKACKADRFATLPPLSTASSTNLIAQTIADLPWGRRTQFPLFDFFKKGQNSWKTAFNLWEMDKKAAVSICFAQKIRGVTVFPLANWKRCCWNSLTELFLETLANLVLFLLLHATQKISLLSLTFVAYGISDWR